MIYEQNSKSEDTVKLLRLFHIQIWVSCGILQMMDCIAYLAMCWAFDRTYQIDESGLSQNLHNANIGNHLKEGKLSSIYTDFPATMHTLRICGQW